jgi:hypothetical protein
MKKIVLTLAAFAALGFTAALAQQYSQSQSSSSCTSSNGVTTCTNSNSGQGNWGGNSGSNNGGNWGGNNGGNWGGNNGGSSSQGSSSSASSSGNGFQCVVNGVVITDPAQCPFPQQYNPQNWQHNYGGWGQ